MWLIFLIVAGCLGAFLAYKTLYGAHAEYTESRKPKKKYSDAELEKMVRWLLNPAEDAKLLSNNRQKRRKIIKNIRKKRGKK
jgi:hypothetical protein